MDHRNTVQRSAPSATTAGMDHSEEILPDVDEPPDERKSRSTWAPPKLAAYPPYNKADPAMYLRRESLLTRQLHSEAEQTDDEPPSRAPPRTLSTQSTWSIPSTASTAELTSDDGHSVASPFHSPPLPATVISTAVPAIGKPANKEPKIAEHDNKLADTTGSEQSVEAGLGRKRCISFACGGGGKDKKSPTSQPTPVAPPVQTAAPSSPPKRKCALKFVCPTRAAMEPRMPTVEKRSSGRRLASPPPLERRSKIESPRVHRGSDSTVTHASPKSVRKTPAVPETAAPIPTTSSAAVPIHRRKPSHGSDNSTEALRFHEFASEDGEPEEWVQESTCYKSRLTVNDTLQKEITIRKACEEVEEEALEEEDAEDDDENDDMDEDDGEHDDDIELESESDDGFRTDDEDGFAESDSEGEDSDGDWWRPGGLSTAATSTDHLDQLAKMKLNDTTLQTSSLGSVSSGHMSPRNLSRKPRKTLANAMPISLRPEPMDLPDSTDFVCGTLDEDRPLEQAFLNHKKAREAAKHKARPQDIDPTFPTSDPEMDEEDDDDLEDAEESENENLMHGGLEDLHGDSTLRHRPANRGRRSSQLHRSPPPPARRRSPAPAGMKRTTTTARSPPPPGRRNAARSPPPTVRRTRSPAPRKLFAHSPKRTQSPAPQGHNMPSPPNTRRASPVSFGFGNQPNVLASRPQLTHTASLPRNGGYTLGKFNGYRMDEGEETETGHHTRASDYHKRGAIDIYKGLEKRRQRRKEKLHAKMCAKAAAKGEKAYKVKPGKGAERMRELGLELQRYRGKGEHILSA